MADTKLSFTFTSEDMKILKQLKVSIGATDGKQSYTSIIRKAIRSLSPKEKR